MHQAALEYVAWARDQIPPPTRVLELGSYNVNGSVRTLWPANVGWHGVDVRPGPGVDEVADARDYNGDEGFDLVVCTETMEHVSQAGRILKSVSRSLSRGGYLIATMAGEGRAPHSGQDGNPLEEGDEEFYHNVTEAQLRRWVTAAGLKLLNIEHDPVEGDLRCIAWKGK